VGDESKEEKPSPQEGRRIEGRIKWFDVARGFGFIVADQGGPDILLHANILQNFGRGSVAAGSRITALVQQSARGVQALKVLAIAPPADVEPAGAVARPQAGGPLLAARVKWFDKAKGFGFVNVFGDDADIFVHVEVMRRNGLDNLQAGEAISIRVAQGPRGLMAVEVNSWDAARFEDAT